MTYYLTLSTSQLDLEIAENPSEETIQLLLHQVMKGDKGDSGDTKIKAFAMGTTLIFEVTSAMSYDSTNEAVVITSDKVSYNESNKSVIF